MLLGGWVSHFAKHRRRIKPGKLCRRAANNERNRVCRSWQSKCHSTSAWQWFCSCSGLLAMSLPHWLPIKVVRLSATKDILFKILLKNCGLQDGLDPKVPSIIYALLDQAEVENSNSEDFKETLVIRTAFLLCSKPFNFCLMQMALTHTLSQLASVLLY